MRRHALLIGLGVGLAFVAVGCRGTVTKNTPMDVAKTTSEDWRTGAWASYLDLKKTYRRVYYVGSSLGGTIGLDLASEHKLDGLILLCVVDLSR